MTAEFTVTPGAVAGTVRVPGSKSVTHRAFLLAAQSDRPCSVARPLRSADTDATLACLHAMGYQVRPEEGLVQFIPAAPRAPAAPLDCRNAGTALRLLAGTAARFPWPTTLTGDHSLQSRPNGPLLAALGGLGVHVEGGDTAPFTLRGPLRCGHARLPERTSSQFASALLLSLPMVTGRSTLELAPPVSSAPYLDVTIDVAAAFGIRIEATAGPGRCFDVAGDQRPNADAFIVEADWSTAAFPLVAAAITGGRVTVDGVRRRSRQGDRDVTRHLAAFGARVDQDDGAVTVTGQGLESPGEVDVAATPDMFPALAVLAACSRGTTTFTGGAALRHKESDRIHAMVEGLRQMGIEAKGRADGAVITGGSLHGARLHAFDDHRIHMAFAVAGLVADGKTVIDGADSARVSYPAFHADLGRLQERR